MLNRGNFRGRVLVSGSSSTDREALRRSLIEAGYEAMPNPDVNNGGPLGVTFVDRAPSLAGRTLEEIERQALLDTLKACRGNKAATARSLGVCEKTIYNKLKRMGMARRGLHHPVM